MLSGFTLSHVYHFNFRQIQWPVCRQFLWHRAVRIFPLHLTILSVFVGLEVARLVAQHWGLAGGEPAFGPRRSVVGLISTALLIHSWGQIPPGVNAWNSPSWSISSEWLVYLIAPFIIHILTQRTLTWVGRLVIAIAIVFLLGQWVAAHNNQCNSDGITGTIRCLAGFSLGSLVYPIYLRYSQSRSAWLADCVVLASVLACLTLMSSSWRPEFFLLSAASLIVALPLSQLGKFMLSNSPLVWLGEVSFSLYLCHYLFVFLWKGIHTRFLSNMSPQGQFAAFCLHMAIIVAVSASLYYCVERPSRRWLRQWGTTSS